MRISIKAAIVIPVFALLSLPFLATCDGDDGSESQPLAVPSGEIDGTVSPQETKVITIGNHTDVTGPASNAMEFITMALEDMVEYYNDQDLVPGVKFEVITYDGQYDPARDISGYEWLKEQGADLITTAVGPTAVILKSHLGNDRMALFTLAPIKEAISPSGWVFSPGSHFLENYGYNLLKWVAENDPDFPNDRPAKIGGAMWIEPMSNSTLTGAKAYAESHSDQYEWGGGHLAPIATFTWDAEIEALKNCDYVIPPIPMHNFAKSYREAGHTAKFVCTEAHTAFLGLIDASDLWSEIDETLFLRASRWWNEEGSLIDLTKELLHKNHPDNAEKIIGSGNGYLTIHTVYVMLELIAEAAEIAGPENLDSQAIYDAANSFTLTIDGVERESFSETKRVSGNYFRMYEASGAEKDLFLVGPEWYPVTNMP